ncbi:hypothetical protein IGI04_007214 [Brassica rapa subsp. trilocularis]|uniref:Uncharacterized protein n=1 Tax=Brassica rapa subsp. trilocularis TaxID=1813537 RepID=A0ABQ7NJ75_BRACM|nr:hypothetical protein IGI04_007214 [Brassica rapa subsp. trilocularis]
MGECAKIGRGCTAMVQGYGHGMVRTPPDGVVQSLGHKEKVLGEWIRGSSHLSPLEFIHTHIQSEKRTIQISYPYRGSEGLGPAWRLEEMIPGYFSPTQSMVERLPGVALPTRKSNPDSYADTPFMDEITLIKMPRKFSFPSIKVMRP